MKTKEVKIKFKIDRLEDFDDEIDLLSVELVNERDFQACVCSGQFDATKMCDACAVENVLRDIDFEAFLDICDQEIEIAHSGTLEITGHMEWVKEFSLDNGEDWDVAFYISRVNLCKKKHLIGR